MSKRKPPPRPAAAPAAPITADSSGIAICRENIRLRMEIIRRQSYQEFLTLQASLAQMPPLPGDGAPHDGDLPET